MMQDSLRDIEPYGSERRDPSSSGKWSNFAGIVIISLIHKPKSAISSPNLVPEDSISPILLNPHHNCAHIPLAACQVCLIDQRAREFLQVATLRQYFLDALIPQHAP